MTEVVRTRKGAPPSRYFNKADRQEYYANRRKRFETSDQRKNDRGLMTLPKEVESRLTALRFSLKKSGKSKDEIKQLLRSERRKAEGEHKMKMKNACYRCRDPNHRFADCPNNTGDMDTLTDVCFKCGSAEHRLAQCKSKNTNLEFVKCFVCSEKGHLSRECPQNPKGLYPYGGSCKICESVNHFARDCPQAAKEEAPNEEPEEEITLETIKSMESADAEIFEPQKKKKKAKVVNF